MRHHQLKLVVVIMLIVILAIVPACANKENASKEEAADTNATTNEANAANKTNTTDETNEPAEETEALPSDLARMKHDPPIGLSTNNIYFNSYLPDGMSPEDHMWTRVLKEKLGIDLTYKYISQTWEDWGAKYNLFMASGDFPDLFRGAEDTLEQLYAADKLTDMKPYFDKYASDELKEVYSSPDGVRAFKKMTRDGKLLGFPSFSSITDDTFVLYIRKDWLDKVGLAPPKTFDEVVTIADAFVNKDPDGDNKKNTYGLSASKTLFDHGFAFDAVFSAYHAYPGYLSPNELWLKGADGKLTAGSIQPEVKTALQKLQDMFKAGLIDREFGTKDQGKAVEDMTSGKSGMFYGKLWAPTSWLQASIDNNPKAEWIAVPAPSADGEPVKTYAPSSNIWVWYFIPKTAKNPEAVIQAANLYYDLKYGPNSDWPTYLDDPTRSDDAYESLAPLNINIPDVGAKTQQAVVDALDGKLAEADIPVYARSFYNNVQAYLKGDQKQWGTNMVYGKDGTYSIANQLLQDELYLVDAYSGPPTKTILEKQATLQTLRLTTFTKIIMGEAKIDEFDKYVSDWKKIAGDAITKEVNEWTANNQ